MFLFLLAVAGRAWDNRIQLAASCTPFLQGKNITTARITSTVVNDSPSHPSNKVEMDLAVPVLISLQISCSSCDIVWGSDSSSSSRVTHGNSLSPVVVRWAWGGVIREAQNYWILDLYSGCCDSLFPDQSSFVCFKTTDHWIFLIFVGKYLCVTESLELASFGRAVAVGGDKDCTFRWKKKNGFRCAYSLPKYWEESHDGLCLFWWY